MADAELDTLRSIADGITLTPEQVAALQEAQWQRAAAMPDGWYPPGSLGAEIQRISNGIKRVRAEIFGPEED